MKKFITTLSLLCVFLLSGCSVVKDDTSVIDPAWAKLASDNSYFDGKGYFNNDASIFTITDGSKSYTFEHVESTTNSATYTGTYEGVDISYSFSGVNVFGGTVAGNTISGPFEWDNNPLLGGAFIIDNNLYMFSSDGKTLTKRVYNTSSKKFTDTVFTSTDFITYTSAGNTIELSSLSAKGGKIGDIDFSFLPFTLGTVDDVLKNATKGDNFYSDSMRLDYDEDSYFISDSAVEKYSQKDENNKNLDLEKYIANYVTNIVDNANANINFDPTKDIMISINKDIDPTGTTITKANAIITGDNDDEKVTITADGCIVVDSEVEGSIIVNGSVSGDSVGICVKFSVSGSIIVNGSVRGYTGIAIVSSVGGSIIVNGSVSSYGYSIIVNSSAIISGSIIVNGSVNGSGYSIYVLSSVGGSIIVSGTVSSISPSTDKSIVYTDITSIYRYSYLTPDMSDDISAMMFSGTRESDKAPASVVEPIYLPTIE